MTKESLLESAKDLLRDEVTTIGYDTWIKNLKIYRLEEDKITLIVESDIHKNFISEKYYDLIKNTFKEITNKEYHLDLITKKDLESQQTFNDDFESEDIDADSYKISNLNPKYTFDTFVVGRNNQIAQATALAVADTPYTKYNPLFIYGGVGLRKDSSYACNWKLYATIKSKCKNIICNF